MDAQSCRPVSSPSTTRLKLSISCMKTLWKALYVQSAVTLLESGILHSVDSPQLSELCAALQSEGTIERGLFVGGVKRSCTPCLSANYTAPLASRGVAKGQKKPFSIPVLDLGVLVHAKGRREKGPVLLGVLKASSSTFQAQITSGSSIRAGMLTSLHLHF